MDPQDLAWFAKFGWPGAVMAGIIILVILEYTGAIWFDDGPVTRIIKALRGPRQIISTTFNTCPSCGKKKTKTEVVDPEA